MLYIAGLIDDKEVKADIFLDGRKIEDKAPYLMKNIKAGEHKIELKHKEYSGYASGTVKKDEMTKLNIPLEKMKGRILITTMPSNAAVYLDGEPIGSSPVNKNNIMHGRHIIKAEKEFYFPFEIEINVDKEDLMTFEYPLEPCGILKVSADPEANLKINNEEKGLTPFEGSFKSGKYSINIFKENYQDINLEEDLQAGEIKEITRKLEYNQEYFKNLQTEKKSTRAKWIKKTSIILTALSAATAVIGIVLGESYYNKYTNADNTDDAVSYRAEAEKWDGIRNISGGLAAGGGIVVIASYKF